MEYIQSFEQVANIFTKAFHKHSFVKFRDKLGLIPNLVLVKEGVLESGNKEGLLALHVSLHVRETLNWNPNLLK